MADRTVGSPEEADALIGRLMTRLGDWRGFWDRISSQPGGGGRGRQRSPILEVQTRYWSRRFDRGFHHAQTTVKERAARAGYYINPTGALARPDFPYFYWTGHTLASTTVIGKKGRREATIDTRENYFGPMQEQRWGGIRDPAGSLLEGAFGVPPWDLPALDRAVDDSIEDWLTDDVLEDL